MARSRPLHRLPVRGHARAFVRASKRPRPGCGAPAAGHRGAFLRAATRSRASGSTPSREHHPPAHEPPPALERTPGASARLHRCSHAGTPPLTRTHPDANPHPRTARRTVVPCASAPAQVLAREWHVLRCTPQPASREQLAVRRTPSRGPTASTTALARGHPAVRWTPLCARSNPAVCSRAPTTDTRDRAHDHLCGPRPVTDPPHGTRERSVRPVSAPFAPTPYTYSSPGRRAGAPGAWLKSANRPDASQLANAKWSRPGRPSSRLGLAR